MNFKVILLILLVYLAKILIHSPQLLTYEFNEAQVKDYLRSQDIEDPEGNIKDRIFISDSEIYTVSGYLYATGSSPAEYNFQHPPFAKYLYGYSILLFNNPYIIQLIFGYLFLVFTFYVASSYFSETVGFLTVGLLLIDPVMLELSENILLDLPLATLMMIYIYSKKERSEKIILLGIILGLMAATKFASTAAIVFGVIMVSNFMKDKKINLRNFLMEIVVASTTYLAVYFGFFLSGNNLFDYVLLQKKMIGFMLTHNTSQYLGNSLVMFLTGFYKDWWEGSLLRADVWTILWPVSFVLSLIIVVKNKKLIYSPIVLLPAIILLSTIKQFAFTRYFIIIIPFLYMLMAYYIVLVVNTKHVRKTDNK